MRIINNLLFYLALPFVLWRLWRKSQQSAELPYFSERLGYLSFTLNNTIWLHAVSLGEAIAAIPLIRALRAVYPHYSLLVTNMTPTGRAKIKAVFGEDIRQAYLPYDFPGGIKRFLTAVQPKIGIIMETELWPNLLHYCEQRKIPVCLMNARLSAKSTQRYSYLGCYMRALLRKLTKIAAQSQTDANHFLSLGATQEQVIVTGNIKFDVSISREIEEKYLNLRALLGKDRLIWIAASTHEGEESMILTAHQQVRAIYPHALLILVPRHPERFTQVVKQCEEIFVTCRHSQYQDYSDQVAVYVGDTIGELLVFYGAADIAFVGGSLIPRGGHNLLEPALLKKPILTGPHLFNFVEISKLFIEHQTLFIVETLTQLSDQLVSLMSDKNSREEMGARAFTLLTHQQGALNKQLAVVQKVLGNC